MSAAAMSSWSLASVCHRGRRVPVAEGLEELRRTAGRDGVRTGEARAGLHVPDGPWTAAGIAWLRAEGIPGALLHADMDRDSARKAAARAGCTHLVSAEGGLRFERLSGGIRAQGACQEVILFTSGTTGEPKPVRHTWTSLAASITVRDGLDRARWMSCYPLTRFAGLNTLLTAMLNQATLIVPERLAPMVLAAEIGRWGATHVSGTPAIWKTLLFHLRKGDPALESVEQITLGGEIVDQGVLRALRGVFPKARLTHIYATTELGVCLSVSDGLAGFPAAWLERPHGAIELRLREGELYVRRSGAGSDAIAASPGGWYATGDRVEVRNGRAYFLGRASEVINVGGAKVPPGEVEACLSEVPGVAQVRVTGKRSSLSGMLIAADVVPVPGTDTAELRRMLLNYSREKLPAYAAPRMIQFVEELPIAASGKMER